MIFHDITFTLSHRKQETNAIGNIDTYYDGLFANCNKLIMGKGITVSGDFNVFGCSGGGSVNGKGRTEGSDAAIFSGNCPQVYAGSFKRDTTENRPLRFIDGTADDLFAGSYQKNGGTAITSMDSVVYLFDGTVVKDLYASSDKGTVTESKSSLLMAGGTVQGSVCGGGNQAAVRQVQNGANQYHSMAQVKDALLGDPSVPEEEGAAQAFVGVRLVNADLTIMTGLNEVADFGSYTEETDADGNVVYKPDASEDNVLTIRAGRLCPRRLQQLDRRGTDEGGNETEPTTGAFRADPIQESEIEALLGEGMGPRLSERGTAYSYWQWGPPGSSTPRPWR